MESKYVAIPLVLIHGPGSTVAGTFGHLLPLLSPERRIIAVNWPAHDRINDRVGPVSIQHEADAMNGLLESLGVARADVLGFGQGGSMTLQMAIRHPERVNRIIVISADHRRDGLSDDALRSIGARALILGSVQDVIRPEETVRMARLIVRSRSIVLPGRHGELLGTEEAGAGMGYADVVANLVDEFISSSFSRAGRSSVLPYAVPLR